MAKSDLDNMVPVRQEAPRTAADNAEGYSDSPNVAENAAAAKANGVLRASFIDYATALAAYESRSDIETLAQKNARDMPAKDADTDFMRAAPAGGSGSGA